MDNMDYSKISVLVADGGARQTLTIIRELKDIGCGVTVLCPDKQAICYSSRYPDNKLVDNDASSASPGYYDFVLKQVKTGKYDVFMPIGEDSTNIITQNENELKKFVRLACASRKSYIQAFNKQNTFEKAMDIGVPCPYTRRIDQKIDEYIEKAHFPVIIKPRQGMGSIGFHKYNSKREIVEDIKSSVFNPDEYVIQEFVYFNKRVSVYAFIDQNGKAKTSMSLEVMRWYPLDAGTAVLTGTIDNQVAINNAVRLLQALEFEGFADVGFMIEQETGELRLLEINGRIPAGIKLSWVCGVNVAKQLLDLSYNQMVDSYEIDRRTRKYARHSQVDLMWFIKSKERFHSKPSWFSWKNTTDLVFWADDPMPYINYTLQSFRKVKGYEKLRKH